MNIYLREHLTVSAITGLRRSKTDAIGLAAKASKLTLIEMATGQIATHSAVLTQLEQVGDKFSMMNITLINENLSIRALEYLGNCAVMRSRTSSNNASALKTVDPNTEPTVVTNVIPLSTVAVQCLRIEWEFAEIIGSVPNRTILSI